MDNIPDNTMSLSEKEKRELINLREEVKEISEQLERSNLVFNHIENGALVTDPDGFITHFNKPYADYLEVDASRLIGKHVQDVIDNTRMHIVAKTGQPEYMLIQEIKGKDLIVQRIPIKKNGKVEAVFGQIMFRGVQEVHSLSKKLDMMETRVKLYEEELTSLRNTRYTLDNIKGNSKAIVQLKEEVVQAASHNLPVLITGESGTGKEVIAQAIHHTSQRRRGSFVRINCAAIPRDLFESELFGYAKGAFTGASSEGKPGKFELAHGGTVFLDEIGELPIEMQPKLLRILEEREFERVGGTKLINADFRVIAATNQNLEDMLVKKHFRKDLFFRLNVMRTEIPPLRERPEDIIPITEYLLEQISKNVMHGEFHLTAEAQKVLLTYDWPGNVRELYNVLERTLSGLKESTIHTRDLPFYLRSSPKKKLRGNQWDLREIIDQSEKNALLDALSLTNNIKTHAARLLGIDRTVLYRKMKKHDIPIKEE